MEKQKFYRRFTDSPIHRLIFFLMFTIHYSLFSAFAESSIAEGISKATAHKAEQEKTEKGKEESLVELLEKRNKELDMREVERKKEFDRREAELNEREARLNQVSLDIEAKIAALRKLRQENEDYFKKLDSLDAKKIVQIVGIYESMPPKEAAVRIEQLDEETAILIFSKIKQRVGAKILSFVEPAKAASISNGLVRRSGSAKK